MLKAMESGAGSISTTHAKNAEGAIGKLVTCAMEAGPHITHDYAVRAIAASIDIIVHVHLETTPLADGTAQRSRWVTEILTLAPGEREKGYAVQRVFLAPPGSRQAEPAVLPDEYRELAGVGIRPRGVLRAQRGRLMTPLVPAVAGALIVAGLLGTVAGLRPRPAHAPGAQAQHHRQGSRPASARALDRRTRLLLAAGAVGGRRGRAPDRLDHRDPARPGGGRRRARPAVAPHPRPARSTGSKRSRSGPVPCRASSPPASASSRH